MGKNSSSQPWTLIKIYRGRQFRFSDVIIFFLPGLCAILSSFFYGGYVYWDAYQGFGPTAAKSWSQPWFFISFTALIIFSSLLFYRLFNARRYAAVYDEGLKLNLTKSKTTTWEEIIGVTAITTQPYFFRLHLPPTQTGILHYRNGQTIKIQDNISDLPGLLSQIKAKVYPILFPRFERDFRSGEKLFFGPIGVDKQHFSLSSSKSAQNRAYNWQQIKHINLQSGNLMIEFWDHPIVSIPAAEIPNIELMLQLIKSEISV